MNNKDCSPFGRPLFRDSYAITTSIKLFYILGPEPKIQLRIYQYETASLVDIFIEYAPIVLTIIYIRT